MNDIQGITHLPRSSGSDLVEFPFDRIAVLQFPGESKLSAIPLELVVAGGVTVPAHLARPAMCWRSLKLENASGLAIKSLEEPSRGE